MAPQLKKYREHSFAFQASVKLAEEWELESRESPDFLVTSAGHRFGLEVTECHIGFKGSKGAIERAKESTNHSWLTEIRRRYEAAGGVGLNMRYRGTVSAIASEELLRALLDARFDTRDPLDRPDRLDLPKGKAYVFRTRDAYWMMLDDRAGRVSQDGGFLQREIDVKAEKLSKYREACSDIRLLVVASRIYNSGKLELQDGFRSKLRGFDAVYFFSYPRSVTTFCRSDEDSSD